MTWAVCSVDSEAPHEHVGGARVERVHGVRALLQTFGTEILLSALDLVVNNTGTSVSVDPAIK